MDTKNLKDKLAGILSGEILDSAEVLAHYSHDASLFEVKPEVVVAPKDASEIKKLVAFVSGEKKSGASISLTARAAGTCMSGGSLNTSIIMDCTKHMNAIGALSDDSIVVEPGVFYRDMEKVTLSKNLILPSYTASKDLCAVGGMVANNSSGEKTLSYGATEKYVRRLKMVLADGNEYEFGPLNREELEEKKKLATFEGEVYRKTFDLVDTHYDVIQAARPKVTKNSAGYYLWNVWDKNTFDLTKLFCGSQGTLGIITSITFGLIPVKKHKKLIVMTLTDLAPLAAIVETVLSFKPESFESYDDHTYDLAVKYMPETAKNVVTKHETLLTLIAEFTSDTLEESVGKANHAFKALTAMKASVTLIENDVDAESYWKIRRASFRLLKEHVAGSHRTAPFIDDIIVSHEKLGEFLPRLNAILQEYKLIYTIAGHIGNGNFHLIPLVNMEDVNERGRIAELADKVFSLVFEYGGSMAGEHNDGLIRTPFLTKMFGPELYALFEETKRIFDPLAIFNPGKKVGGSIEASMAYLAKTNVSEHL